MCGLTGILVPRERTTDALHCLVQKMTAALVHRGPDADGIWAEDGIALGHRRLSILDLSPAGAQPMHSVCGRFVIVFNGEVYNHLDLRRDLMAAGAAPDWRGHSDTETLLAGIAHWGLDETLRRSAGMFAVALWDRRERQLSLARDRIGEKPVYWGWAGRALVFGSELKALRQRGVLIVASGNVVHNLQQAQRGAAANQAYDWALEFDQTIAGQVQQGQLDALQNFQKLGSLATMTHPTYEHFLPLLYAAGAVAPCEQPEFFNTSFQLASISMRSMVWGGR